MLFPDLPEYSLPPTRTVSPVSYYAFDVVIRVCRIVLGLVSLLAMQCVTHSDGSWHKQSDTFIVEPMLSCESSECRGSLNLAE